MSTMDKDFTWEVMVGVEGSNHWSLYDDETQGDLEQAYQQYNKNPQPGTLELLLAKGMYKHNPVYRVNFRSFTQQNVHTGYVRAIRRRPIPSADTVVPLYYIDRSSGMLEYMGPENSAALYLSPASEVWLNFGPYGPQATRFVASRQNGVVFDVYNQQQYKLVAKGQKTCAQLNLTVRAPASSSAPVGPTSAPPAATALGSKTDTLSPAHVLGSHPSSVHPSSTHAPAPAHAHKKQAKHAIAAVKAALDPPSTAPATSMKMQPDNGAADKHEEDDQHHIALPLQTEALPRDTHGAAVDASLPAQKQLQALGVDVVEVKQSSDKCPVCMGLFFEDDDDDDSDFDDDSGTPIRLPCRHEFHDVCIAMCIKGRSFKCPVCPRTYGEPPMGDMPDGHMFVRLADGSLPGFPGTNTIEILYSVPSGIQSSHHPEPGKRFGGTSRTAFLPNTATGRKVLKLFKKAFEYRHIFTVNHSVTLGPNAGMRVVWAGIHHKTGVHGPFGYPDDTYLDRVQQELKDFGITL